MAKRETLRIPLDFDQVMSDLLKVKPPVKAAKPKKRIVSRKRGPRGPT
jgi:hypothetical protein